VAGDQMSILIAMTCVAISTFVLIRKIGKNKRNEYIKWGLGVDSCCFYSSPFKVDKCGITIVGFQEVVDGKSAIQYSVIKKNWWGKRTIFGQGFIHGDYKNPQCFHITVSNIPNGVDYQIEIFNRFNMSFGQFKVVA
jgi:hypothetical protein